MPVASPVTAEAIRDGEPAALARLCIGRGGAVLAYAEHVAPGKAGVVAAAALAEFRARIATGGRVRDPGALLLGATRRAAAARTDDAGDGEGPEGSSDCITGDLLEGWMEETLAPAQRTSFEEHVADCRACFAKIARFEAAERAYQNPPQAALPADVARLIVRALVAAAPVTACGGDAAEARAAAQRLVSAKRTRTPVERPAVVTRAPEPENDVATRTPTSARPVQPPRAGIRPLASRLSFRARMADQRAEVARQRAAATVAELSARAAASVGAAAQNKS